MKTSIISLTAISVLTTLTARAGLVSVYEFNESGGATAADAVRGAGGAGTANGGTSFVPGRIGNAVEFDGSSGWIMAPNTVPTGATAFSVTAWVWADSAPNWGTIVKNWGGASTGAFHLGFNLTSGQISNYVSPPTVGPAQDPSVLSLNAWRHVALTYDGAAGTQILYIDGVQVAAAGASPSLVALGANMGIGVKTDDSTAAPDPANPGFWDGRIDDLAFWDNALTPAEVLQIKVNGDNGIGVVPEPGAAAFLLLAAAGMVRRRR